MRASDGLCPLKEGVRPLFRDQLLSVRERYRCSCRSVSVLRMIPDVISSEGRVALHETHSSEACLAHTAHDWPRRRESRSTSVTRGGPINEYRRCTVQAPVVPLAPCRERKK